MPVEKEFDFFVKIFMEVDKAVKIKDISSLKRLSNEAITEASIEQDSDVLTSAIVIYSLSKIFEREHYHKLPSWDKFYRNLKIDLQDINKALFKNDKNRFHSELESLRSGISKLSGNLKRYIQDVFHKASINNASKLYQNGISLGRTTELLGISRYELASFAGQRNISDEESKICHTCSTKDRIKIAMGLFE